MLSPIMEKQPDSPVLTLTRYSLILLAVVLFGIVVRSYGLDNMTMGHDESIHAMFSHYIYSGNFTSYRYDPTYHGPFLYHITALTYSIFGDSDITARLPMVAFGVLFLYFIWRLKPWIGPYGVMFTMILAATSPTMSYFSRYARNDMFMAAMAMGILVFALEYIRSRKTSHLVWMTIYLALMYCTKENSYMTGFVLGSFLTFYAVYHVWSYVPEARRIALADIFVERAPLLKLATLYALFSFTAFTLVMFVCYNNQFHEMAVEKKISRGADTLTMPILHDTWYEFIPLHPWIYPVWITVAIIALCLSFLGYTWVRSRIETSSDSSSMFARIARNNFPVMLSLFAAVGIYSFLFTTMGTNPIGMSDGIIDYLLYWMGQHGTPRIPGPPDYFIGRLLIYEFAAVLIGIIAYLFYTWRSLGTMNFFGFQFVLGGVVYMYWNRIQDVPVGLGDTILVGGLLIVIGCAFFLGRFALRFVSLPEPEFLAREDELNDGIQVDGVRWLFIYWTLMAVLIYAMLEEKVSWLMVHQAQPLILLAGVFLGDVFSRMKPGVLRNVFIGFVALLAVYEGRSAWQVNIMRPDDARELIFYNHTDRDMLVFFRHVKETAELLGPDYQKGINKPPRPILAYPHDSDMVWPTAWYFRNYTVRTFSSSGSPEQDVPFVIAPVSLENRLKVWSQGKYSIRRMNFRNHWDPQGKNALPFQHFRNSETPLHDSWDALWDYFLWRKPWEPVGNFPMLVLEKQPIIETEAPPEVPRGYERAPQPLQVLATFGTQGGGEDQLNEPRGIALSPDEQTVYVLDSRNGRIQVLDSDLQYQTTFGSPGTGDGQFTLSGFVPNGGIDTGPDGTIYATDTWGPNMGRVVRFRPDGTPLPSLAPPANDPFFYPRGLAVGPDGRIYVADTGKHRVVVFTPDGQYLGAFLEGIFREPVGLAISSDNRVFVCDVGGQRVIEFSSTGQFQKQWKVLGWEPDPSGNISWIEPYVALDPENNIYTTDSTTNTMHVFQYQFNQVFQFGGPGQGRGQVNGPRGVTISSRYEVYLADTLNHRVVKAMAVPSSQ